MVRDPYSIIISNYGWLVDLYMIDYVVESQWKKLPSSWRCYFDSLLSLTKGDRMKIRDLMKFILYPTSKCPIDHELLCKIRKVPAPLSFSALKICINRLSYFSSVKVTHPNDFLKFIERNVFRKIEKFTKLNEVLPSSLRIKIKEKKNHEISRLYDLIRLIMENIPIFDVITEVVDFGAGLGHLSRILSILLDFKVTTIEGNEQLVQRANKIDLTTRVSLDHRKRQEKIAHLPTDWRKPDRKAMFIQHEHEITPSSESRQMLLGLHTCGDFAAIIIKHFISNGNAGLLINFGCCYHKLNGGLDKLYRDIYKDVKAPIDHHGFPLSRRFNDCKLSYAARELACFGREQFIKRLDDSIREKALFVNCYRAILEWIILGCPNSGSSRDFNPMLRHQGLRGVRGAEKLTFWEYAEETLKEKAELKQHFKVMCESRPNIKDEVQRIIAEESEKILLVYTLRLMLAPVIENIILEDRKEFLLESGQSAYLVPVFDANISPRNIALVSWKSM